MARRRTKFILPATLYLSLGLSLAQSADNVRSTLMPVVARIHWSGMTRLAGDTNDARLIAIRDLPESHRLEQQTLDKLSRAPWPLLHRKLDTNAAAFLRPLLDDLVANESYLQIRQLPNIPAELVLAVQLDDRRAALWQTNLAVVLESLTGIRPVPAPRGSYGWSLNKHHAPNVLELTRVGRWTVFGAAEELNGLLAELRARTGRNLPIWTVRNGKDWLEADFDPARLASYLTTLFSQSTGATDTSPLTAGGSIPAQGDKPPNWPGRIYFALTGDGTKVLTRGTADFPRPLALDLKPWNVPTNLIDQRLSSITLIRGFRPWLESAKVWTDLHAGPPPDQICLWALKGLPMQSYFTAPVANASNEVDRITGFVLQNQHHWFPPYGLAVFVGATNSDGLEWKGLPMVAPFLQSVTIRDQGYIYGGGFPNTGIYPLPETTLQNNFIQTNLVYHDWELASARVEQWLFMLEITRMAFNKAQLPPDTAAISWVKAISPHLSEAVTDITWTGPNQLSFTRKSTVGLTAVELGLLADWLESPQFPRGLHTFLVRPSAQ